MTTRVHDDQATSPFPTAASDTYHESLPCTNASWNDVTVVSTRSFEDVSLSPAFRQDGHHGRYRGRRLVCLYQGSRTCVRASPFVSWQMAPLISGFESAVRKSSASGSRGLVGRDPAPIQLPFTIPEKRVAYTMEPRTSASPRRICLTQTRGKSTHTNLPLKRFGFPSRHAKKERRRRRRRLCFEVSVRAVEGASDAPAAAAPHTTMQTFAKKNHLPPFPSTPRFVPLESQSDTGGRPRALQRPHRECRRFVNTAVCRDALAYIHRADRSGVDVHAIRNSHQNPRVEFRSRILLARFLFPCVDRSCVALFEGFAGRWCAWRHTNRLRGIPRGGARRLRAVQRICADGDVFLTREKELIWFGMGSRRYSRL